MDADTAAEHIRLLHKACCNIAHLEAQDAPQGRLRDPSLRQQLCRLTTALLRSVHPELMTFLCSSIIQVHTSLSGHVSVLWGFPDVVIWWSFLLGSVQVVTSFICPFPILICRETQRYTG